MQQSGHFSLVLETPAASPAEANAHFLAKLSVETDVADLMSDLNKGVLDDFVLLDVRDQKSFEECHIPTATHFSTRQIDSDGTKDLSKDKVIVVYCWGPACNGATKAAVKFSSLGFRVKELLGGIEYWRKEGGHVEGTLADSAPMYWHPAG
jgi:rhodanese-related sulfurtransferase